MDAPRYEILKTLGKYVKALGHHVHVDCYSLKQTSVKGCIE